MLDEEWNDALEQVLLPAHAIGPPITMVRSHDSTAKMFLQRIAFVLHNGELRKNLITAFQVGVTINPDMKAAFTIHEACDPFGVKLHWWIPDVKSLRVPCAARAFPADCPHVRLIFTARGERASTERLCEEIPAYGLVLLGLAFTNLRTVRLCYSRFFIGGADISAALFASPRRPDYIITIRSDRVWRVVSEDSRTKLSAFRPSLSC